MSSQTNEAGASAARVLVVDDDPGLRRLISMRLESAGHQVDAVDSGEAALGSLAGQLPDLVITDLRMPGMDGMSLFRHLRERLPGLPVIILTAHGTIPDAVAASREGAFAFLTKPFDGAELLGSVADALDRRAHPVKESRPWRRDILTRNRLMGSLLDELELIAASDASVLIQGESGTGKELIAKAIHAASERSEQPFVALNCAAVPADLLEVELFGHRKGAFTGADRDREGLLAQADGGTLFLDEIGDMPMAFQAKLLRALQEQRFRPVGAEAELEVDVRVVSATHCDLEAAMSKGAFREDLYYRINVVRLDVPPLRQRPEDIPLLAEHFLIRLQNDRTASQRLSGFSPEAIRVLLEGDWPGNVRQLANVVEQATILCRQGPVPEDLVRRALRQESKGIVPLSNARAEFERDYLARVMRMTGGNVSEAARLAGRNRTEFYRLLKRYHLKPEQFKA